MLTGASLGLQVENYFAAQNYYSLDASLGSFLANYWIGLQRNGSSYTWLAGGDSFNGTTSDADPYGDELQGLLWSLVMHCFFCFS
jgi:hypothetical protein